MTDPICPAGTLPRPDPRLWLGCTVTMETDRPIGYTHTKNGHTFTYPINYGYIPGVTGGDGEELDVYLLGVDRPVRRFTGIIIGAVVRTDDEEDKLVMHFQEKYHNSYILTAPEQSRTATTE